MHFQNLLRHGGSGVSIRHPETGGTWGNCILICGASFQTFLNYSTRWSEGSDQISAPTINFWLSYATFKFWWRHQIHTWEKKRCIDSIFSPFTHWSIDFGHTQCPIQKISHKKQVWCSIRLALILLTSAIFSMCSNFGKSKSLEVKFGQYIRNS